MHRIEFFTIKYAKLKFNKTSVVCLVSRFYSRNTCLHLAEHNLGNAAVERVTPAPFVLPTHAPSDSRLRESVQEKGLTEWGLLR